MKSVVYLLSLLFFISACSNQENSSEGYKETQQNSNTPKADITEQSLEESRQAMTDLMNSYLEAARALDAEKMNSFYLNSPDFKIIEGNKTKNYSVATTENTLMSRFISEIKGEWNPIHIIPLTGESAIAMVYYDLTFVVNGGKENHIKGEATWSAVETTDGTWKFLHAHGFYEEIKE